MEQLLRFKVGDRVVTPTGRKGVVVSANADMPIQHLISFDKGGTWWVLIEMLKAVE